MFTTQQGPDRGWGFIPVLPSWPLWLNEASLLGAQQPPPRPPCGTQNQASISLQAPTPGHGPQVGLPELRGAAPSPEYLPDITY